MTNRRSALAAFVALALALTTGTSIYGTETTALHTNILTFSGPVALPGVTLSAGTYVFERLDQNNPDIIVVRSHDRSRVYFMAFTGRADRPADLPADRAVTFGEARRGTVPPIAAWYPMNELRGHKFIYRAR
jgi:hypothetical protein